MASFAQTAGKQVKKNIKQAAVKGVSKALFGKGVVGGALAKTFEGRFKEKQEADDRVPNALSEQAKMQSDNAASLTRIETITMNIADNVYNLAGVMNAQVVSMKEAQRLQKERMFKEAAAAEEAGAEAKHAPTPAATPAPAKKDGSSMLSNFYKNIVGRVGGVAKMFGGFVKKFGLLSLGIAGAMTAITAFAKTGEEPTTPEPSEQTTVPEETAKGEAQATQTDAATPTATTPAASTPASEATKPTVPAVDPMAMMKDHVEKHGSEKDKANMPMIGNIMGATMSGDMGGIFSGIAAYQAANPQPAEPAAPPPPPAASAPPPAPAPAPAAEQPSAEDQIKALEERKASLDKRTAQRLKAKEMRKAQNLKRFGESDPEKAKMRNDSEDEQFDAYQKEVDSAKLEIDKNIATLKAGGSVGGSPSAPASASAPAAPETPKPMASTASSGAALNSSSTSVAAAQESAGTKTDVSSITNNSSANQTQHVNIPSPVANRGSLDNDIFFSNSGG